MRSRVSLLFWLVLLVFLVALTVRLLILPAAGNVSDITGLVLFGAQVAAHGPHTLYDAPEVLRPYYVIPPVFPFLLGATYWLWGLLTGAGSTLGVAQFPGVPEYPLAASFVKLWAIGGDLAFGAVTYAFVSRHAGQRWGLACAAAYLFNPGVIYDSAWWGQIESLFVVCVALSLISLLRRRPAQAGLWLALGLGVKPQVIVVLPVLGLLALITTRWRGVARLAAVGGGIALFVSAPFWATGRLAPLIANYTGAAGIHPQVSVNAYNLWTALGGPSLSLAGLPDLSPAAGGLSFRAAGFILLIAYTTFVAWCVFPPHRLLGTLKGAGPPASQVDPASHRWLLAAAALYCAFFMLPTQIHERYLYPGMALLSLVLARRPQLVLIYLALSLGFFVNLVRVVPWDPGVQPVLDALGFTAWRTALSNVIAFIGLTCLLLVSRVPLTQTAAISRRAWLTTAAAGTVLLAAYVTLIQIVPLSRFQSALVDGWLIVSVALVAGCAASAVDAVRPERQRGTIAPWISRGASPL